MKKVFYIILTFLTFANFSISYAQSTTPKTLIFENHYSGDLLINISRYPEFIPNWPMNYVLKPGERSRETVVVPGPTVDSQAFVNVYNFLGKHAFTFLSIAPGRIGVLVDPTPGLAFSYDKNDNQTLIFCDSSYFVKNKHC